MTEQKLPEKFINNMHQLFAKAEMLDEWEDFIQGFDKDWTRAWRLQVEKTTPQAVAKNFVAESALDYEIADYLQNVPWAEDGYYIPKDAKPGKSLAYILGLLYIQEASAMLPAEVLAAKPGEHVLDLCAAPGGKSSQIAKKLNGEGLLVANDISESRARILAHNLEQQGYANTLVTHFDVNQGLPQDWYGYFDAVQLDVPCSGEGMFRRDNQAISSWEDYGPESIRKIQMQLLNDASELVRAGGRIAYSTCTFNTWENEEVIVEFLESHPEFRIEDPREYMPGKDSLREGIVINDKYPELISAVRIWPQDNMGEGHFCTLLVKDENYTQEFLPEKAKKIKKKKSKGNNKTTVDQIKLKDALEVFWSFCENNKSQYYNEKVFPRSENNYRIINEKLYLMPNEFPELEGIHLLKSGCYLGDINTKGKRISFNPMRTMLLPAPSEYWKFRLELDCFDERVYQLIQGETLFLEEDELEKLKVSGIKDQEYIAVTVEGLPLSWVKLNGRGLKNLFPRKLIR